MNNHYTIFNKIISIFFITLVFSIILFNGCSAKQRSPIDYVDPIIGTAEEGHTFPGACLPFGMVQLSPDNAFMGVKGYVYSNKSILGFSHTHLSGTGPGTKTHYNNILVMPTTGELEIAPAIVKARNIASKKLQDKLSDMSQDDRLDLLWEESRKLLKNEKFAKSIKGYESVYPMYRGI